MLTRADAGAAASARHRGSHVSDEAERVGLCLRCVHARIVRSRTSTYWRCALAEVDPRFERYPRLPVVACEGFRERPEESPPA